MNKAIMFVLFSTLLTSCASTKSSKSVAFVDQPQKNCSAVASLYSTGFSLIPPIASHVAKSVIEEKAKQFEVNSIVINKQTGLFQVNIEATGYKCIEKVSKK
ncbi:hypothetical protein ACJVC5_02040 [Peredibacter sp. HCB2-198]|uniref:hypothetical protein n=1 Tax=Peredibacter sp. HCB2-198 TaxID=3383025 RepID=UPI0038B47B97